MVNFFKLNKFNNNKNYIYARFEIVSFNLTFCLFIFLFVKNKNKVESL